MRFFNRPCVCCLHGKKFCTKFLKSTKNKATKIFHPTHLDGCGLFQMPSLGGAHYFVNFIDNYSRRTWVYFMACKDEVFNKFHLFWQEVEIGFPQQRLALRTDNNGEHYFSTYCAIVGINTIYCTPFNIMVWPRTIIVLYLTSFDVFPWIKYCFNSYGEKLFE
jgi:hypothetical protein